jgi:hypothetical protein
MDITKEDMDKRNSLPYPMELGSPAFAPIDVAKEKDVLYNAGKLNAHQEYDRIMEQVAVLKKQADSLHRRMQVSDVMHGVTYGIKVVHGKTYYVYLDTSKNTYWLSLNHPNSWSALGQQHEFSMAVRLMGDSTWQEVLFD